VILEARQYLLRDNVYYYGFQGVKKIIQSRGSSDSDDLTAGVKPVKSKAGQIKTSFSWTSPVTSAVSSPTNTFSSDLIPNSGR